MIDCNVTSNDAEGGGGVRFHGGNEFDITWVVSNCTFAANFSQGVGGGGLLAQRSGGAGALLHRLTVCSSAFLSNRVNLANGGGIGVHGPFPSYVPTFIFRNSTFHGNIADGGGWISGGAFALYSGSNFILNCTIAANTSEGVASGIRQDAGVTRVENSIVSDLGGSGNRVIWMHYSTMIATNSLIRGLLTGGVTTAGCILDINPLLSPPADNGGPTWTCALAANSPARNAADPVTAPRLDQRGFLRDSTPDMGAFEFGARLPRPPGTILLVR